MNYHAKWLLPLRLLLLPLALLYGGLMQLRNFLYDLKVYQSHRFPTKVISIGNLSAGGSGKTPVTIFLAQMLQKKYGTLAVVSRGYGRKSKGLQLVSDGEKIYMTAERAGDEPMLIARKLSGVAVVVAEKRAEGIAFLLQNIKPAVILLDDAFQHRAVFRDLNIVLINPNEPLPDRWPLPSGFYREFSFNYARADILLYNQPPVSDKRQKVPAFEVGFKLGNLLDWQFQIIASIDRVQNKRVGAFAGIAHPQNFLKNLQDRGVKVVFFRAFDDHHDYTAEEITRLISRCQQEKVNLLLCTEKDMIKLSVMQEKIFQRYKVKILAAALDVDMKKKEIFEKKVYQAIDR